MSIKTPYTCFNIVVFFICTWIDDGVLPTEGDPRIPSFPLRPLNLQVALLNCQEGDALIVSRVKLRQVLG